MACRIVCDGANTGECDSDCCSDNTQDVWRQCLGSEYRSEYVYHED
jgi:hypothetical protein